MFGMKRVKQVKAVSGLWKHRAGLFAMFRDMFIGRYKASFITKVAVLLGLLYILSPMDLIPDFIPLLGWADDGAVLYFLVQRLKSELDRYNNQLMAKS